MNYLLFSDFLSVHGNYGKGHRQSRGLIHLVSVYKYSNFNYMYQGQTGKVNVYTGIPQ